MKMRAVIIAAMLTHSAAALGSETLHCSKSFQGYLDCTDLHGHRCIQREQRDGRIINDLAVHLPPETDTLCAAMPQQGEGE